mmetsp:Transcript_20689/g.29097  ORF Transcript_20689/g.29097 Transcript_20689/m.29097 type:complete len:126 (-) Transcript_20689:165-542(-)
MFHFFSQVLLCSLLHLGKDHRRDLFGRKMLLSTLKLYLNGRFALVVSNFEGPKFLVRLHCGVLEFAPDQTFCVKHGVLRIHGGLVLGSLTDETFRIREGDVRRGRPVALVIGDNLYVVVLHDAHA